MDKKDCTHNFKPVGRYLFKPERKAVILQVYCTLCDIDAIEVYPYSHTEDMDGVKVE